MKKPLKTAILDKRGKMIQIVAAKPEEIDDIWATIWPHLKPAIDEDLFTDENMLKTQLKNDQSLMFIALVDGVVKGAAVAVIEEARGKVVNIVTLGGTDFVEWKQAMNDALTLYAKGMGCEYIVALGRDAWERLWPDFVAGKRLYTKRIAA